jgi:hypothetical protein
VGGGFISRLWHPDSYQTAASGFAATGVGFGAEAGMNVVREFWPEIRHPHRHAAASHDLKTLEQPGPAAPAPQESNSNGGQP